MLKHPLYAQYTASENTKSFAEFVLAHYDYAQWELKETKEWEKTLETLLCNIHRSGLLEESEFKTELSDIFSSLNV